MKNIYLETYNKKECNGCGLCTLGCPADAIHMVEDSEGFYYPKIDEEKCIKCNKCKNICSNYNDSEKKEDVYMAINNDKQELKNSSSGGMFYILAKYVINRNGVVFGVEYGENFKVQHAYYNTLQECRRFQESKYVRSDLRNTYKEVKEFLNNDKYVLFTGTPCQCQGLKTYLNKKYDKLILCDIVCHATPSQKIFDQYIKGLEKRKRSKIMEVHFRTKSNGWQNKTPVFVWENNEVDENDTYFNACVGDLIDRPSCYSCKFASPDRVTDFTIGDFWGFDKVIPEVNNDDTGVSLFTVNSENGKKVFEEIKNNMKYIKTTKEKGFKYNHNRNILPHRNRKKFFSGISNEKINENNIIFYMERYMRKPLYRRALSKIKKILKKVLAKLKK